MFNNDKSFNELKLRLEGKTIVSIDPPNAGDGICKFILSDGACFRLHATDIGFWIEETHCSNGRYRSFSAIFIDYSHYVYDLESQYYLRSHANNSPILGDYNVPSPKVYLTKNLLKIKAVDGKIFELERKYLNDYESMICNHPKALNLLKQAACFGYSWTFVFSKNNEKCPPELYDPNAEVNCE